MVWWSQRAKNGATLAPSKSTRAAPPIIMAPPVNMAVGSPCCSIKKDICSGVCPGVCTTLILNSPKSNSSPS